MRPASSPSSRLSPNQASDIADQLLALLDQEFEHLKTQDLTAFEALQPQKSTLLTELAQLQLSEPTDAADPWNGFRSRISECKDRHRRNEILLQRKLDAIKAALRTLQGPDPLNAVEVYDRMGRLNGPKRGRGLGQA